MRGIEPRSEEKTIKTPTSIVHFLINTGTRMDTIPDVVPGTLSRPATRHYGTLAQLVDILPKLVRRSFGGWDA